MIEAANLTLDFSRRRSITADELKRLQEPACIFEGTHIDSDGEVAFLYTVAGWLDGHNIATLEGGCTVGGEAILIHAFNRAHADVLACYGLEDTINALATEDQRYIEAHAALARLRSVAPLERMAAATRPDKSDQFVDDVDAIRPLIGDDIVLTTRGGPPKH